MRFDEVIRKYGYPLISKETALTIYEARRTIMNGNPATYKLDKILGRAVDKNGNKSRFNIEKYAPLLETDFIV